MCTVMFFRETLPAEKMSRGDAQKAVDELMDFDRKLDVGIRESPPAFDGAFHGGCGGAWRHPERVYVWLDNCCFGNSDKKGFYYVRYQLSMLAWGTTAYAHPALIVQKKKLRPDQIEYMERKCRETVAAAERAAAAE